MARTLRSRGGRGTVALDLEIEGMTCASCAARLERVIGEAPGVEAVSVVLADDRMRVTGSQGSLSVPQLIRLIEAAGFGGRLAENRPNYGDRKRKDALGERKNRRRLFVCLILTAPFLVQMGGMFGLPWPGIHPVLQLVLAASVQIVAGAVFYPPAWKAVRAGAGNMDLLVVLGTTTAFGLSCYVLFRDWTHSGRSGHGADLYFEASAMVLTLVLLGRWLEARARRTATQGLSGLAKLRPDLVHVIRKDGDDGFRRNGETVVDMVPAMVRVDDIVLVRAGERVPVDGVVLDGLSSLDRSLITGESRDVDVRSGDSVRAGALNGFGPLKIRTTRSDEHSTLERLISLVRDAGAAKPAVQKLVDRVSAVFVPIVVGLSLLTGLCWWFAGQDFETALIHAVTVLVIACPCSLGLATPTALMAGIGRAAQRGILIRNPDALEHSGDLRHIVFDKTGTLTEGRPALASIALTGSGSEEEVLTLAAGLQRGATHPLAKAVLDAVQERDMGAPPLLRDVQTIPGRGVMGKTAEGMSVLLGNERLMRERGVALARAKDRTKTDTAPGMSVSFLAVEDMLDETPTLAAVFGFSDQPRPGGDRVIEGLRGRGPKPILLTGDAKSAARDLGAALGFRTDEIIAEVLPEDKLDVVERLRSKGHGVCMVGDGVNDAPALARADLSIAMGTGADVAMETADITLMRPDLGLIAEAMDIAAATRRTVRQNLVWAFLYNVVALPLAVFGLLTPVAAGAAMAMSSVCVVGNAARLALAKRQSFGETLS